MLNLKRSWMQRYGFAVLAVAIALLLRLLLKPLLGIESPFLLFFATVMLSAWYGGMGAGVVATILSALASDYFFLSPTYSLLRNSLEQNVRLVVFVLEELSITWLIAQLHAAKLRAEVNQRRLQESETRARRLVDSSLIGIITADIDGSITEANDAFLKMVGYTQEDLLTGKVRWDVMTPPEYGAADRQAIAQMQTTGVSTPYEKEYIRKDGSRIPILLGSAMFEGSQQQGVGFVLDLSSRKQTEQALQQALQKLTFHVDNSPLAVVEWDRNHRVSRWSQQAEIIFGWKAEEVLGKQPSDWEFVYPEDLDEVKAVIERLIDGREQRNMVRNRNYTKDGSIVYCEWYSSALLDESGNLESVLCLVLDVTQPQQLQEALQQKAIEQEALLNSIPALVYYKDRHSNYIAVNRTFAEITNKPIAEIPGKTDFDLFPHCEALAFRQDDQEVIALGQPKLNIEEPVTRADGKTIWTATYKTPYRDRLGEITGLVGITIDITQRKQVEEALRQSEERFRIAASSANDLIYEWDIASGRLEWFGNIDKQLGYDDGEFPRTLAAWEQIIHPDDRDRVLAAVEQHLKTGEPFFAEYRVQRQDGTFLYWTDRATAIWDQQGNPYKSIGVNTDITERKSAEEQIRMHATRMQALADVSRALSEAILEFQAVLDTVSRLIAELIGDTCAIRLLSEDGQWFELVAIYHSQSAAIAPMRELLAAPQSSHGGLMAQVMQTGQPLLIPVVSQEELSNSVNQSYLTYLEQFNVSSILIAPLRVRGCAIGTLEIFRDRSDYPYTVDDLVFLQDLADRAALAIENARLYHQALEANRLKDDFLAVVSHELRTPINAVLGWATLLRTRKFNPEKTAQALEVIERNAKLQTQLIEDLLDISRLLRGELRLNCRPLDLIPVLEAAIKTVLPTAEAKSINFRFSILDFGSGDSAQEPATIEANELAFNLKSPTPNPKFLVWADPDRLQQVIWNLLSNAIKFTPTGGRVEVRLSLVNSSSFMGNGNQQSTINNYTNYIQIQVSDTGKGISPDFLPYVFDRFRQAENAITRSQGGLGLGLAIVRQLVELHGGNVCADSSGIGQGATFTVKLPLWETVKSEEIFGQPVLA